MEPNIQPSDTDSQIFWDKQNAVLVGVLVPFVDDVMALLAMTTEQLQAELHKRLQNSVGA